MFDFTGKSLASLNVFRYVDTGAIAQKLVESKAPEISQAPVESETPVIS